MDTEQLINWLKARRQGVMNHLRDLDESDEFNQRYFGGISDEIDEVLGYLGVNVLD